MRYFLSVARVVGQKYYRSERNSPADLAAGGAGSVLTRADSAPTAGLNGAQEQWAREQLERAGFWQVDYVTVRDAATLEEANGASKPARVLAAAWLGKARLIDNVAV